eukprot:3856643-Amphidinium_carterae.1
MEDTMNQLIAEVQRLVTEQQAQAGVIANLRQELATARTIRAGAGGSQKMVPLKLGNPPMFTGDEAAFEDWAFKFKAFMGQESTNAIQWMREMESATDALDFDLYVDEKKREAVSLHFRLVVLTDKTALGMVKQVGNQDGFEAYRSLAIRYAPRTLESR